MRDDARVQYSDRGHAARPGMFAAYATQSARWLCLQRSPRISTPPSAAHLLNAHQIFVQNLAADRNRQKGRRSRYRFARAARTKVEVPHHRGRPSTLTDSIAGRSLRRSLRFGISARHELPSSAAKAAVARLIGTDGAQKVHLAKGRPQHICKVELTVHALP
jgi:hypothetical protein